MLQNEIDQSNYRDFWSAIYQEGRNCLFSFKVWKYSFQKERNLDFVFRCGQVCPEMQNFYKIAACALDY